MQGSTKETPTPETNADKTALQNMATSFIQADQTLKALEEAKRLNILKEHACSVPGPTNPIMDFSHAFTVAELVFGTQAFSDQEKKFKSAEPS